MNKVFIVGCGGTGSNVASMLARMLDSFEIILFDADVVEEKNVERQLFQKFNIGENKAEALSRKLNSNLNYNSVYFKPIYLNSISDILTDKEKIKVKSNLNIIIGCVDNNSTRFILEDVFKEFKLLKKEVLYIDCGNEDNFGTVLVSDNNEENLRSEIFSLDKNIDDHPEHHCSVSIAEGNLQQYQINMDIALSAVKVVNSYVNKRKFPHVIKINDFERNCCM